MKFGSIYGSLMAAALIAGCSSGHDEARAEKAGFANQASAAAPMAADAAKAPFAGGLVQASNVKSLDRPIALQHRDVIRTVDLKVRVPNTEKAEQQISRSVTQAGGFVESEEGTNLSGQSPTMAMHVKVPAGSLDTIITGIEHLGVRLEKSIKSSDVTAQLIDQDARIKTMLAQEDSLRAMLRQTSNLENSMSIQQRLAELRGQIESIQSQRKELSDQAALSTLNVTLEQDAVTAAPPSSDPNWFSQSWAQASSAGIAVGRGLVIFSLWLLVFSPVAVVIYAIGSRIRKSIKPPMVRPNAPDPTHLQ